MGLDLGNFALGVTKDDDVSVANLTTKLAALTATSIQIGSSSSSDLNILGDIVVAGLVDGVDIAALNTTVAGLGAPAWSSITGTPTTLSGYGITDIKAEATNVANGGLKIHSTAANGVMQVVTTTANKNYSIQHMTSGTAMVNVPWTDTNTTYNLATASTKGLCLVDSTGATAGSLGCEEMEEETEATRRYLVQHDSNSKLSVCVPWVDTNTQLTIGTGATNAMAGNNASFPSLTNEFGNGGTSTVTQKIKDSAALLQGAGSPFLLAGSNAFGTDQSGGDVTIRGGLGTGAVYGGNIIFETSLRAPSSSTVHTETKLMEIDAHTQYLNFTAMNGINSAAAGNFVLNADVSNKQIFNLDGAAAANASSIRFSVYNNATEVFHVRNDSDNTAAFRGGIHLGWTGTNSENAHLAWHSAGNLKIANNVIYRAGGTDVPITDGGTGASNLADAKTNLEIPVDLTTDGAGTVHANNYTNTTYSEATGSAEGLMSTAHHDKLDAIEASADVTDATNVEAAGALMDSEVTNLAQVKAFDSSDYQPVIAAGARLNANLIGADGSVGNTEYGYLDGVTNPIQTQLDAKAPLNSPQFTGTASAVTAGAGTNSTQLATTAFVKTAVDAKYSYSYIMWHGRSSDSSTHWHFPDATTDGEFNWEDDDEAIAAWDGGNSGIDNDGTNTTAGTSTASLPRDIGVMGVVLPYDCTLVGFTGVGRDLTGNDPFKAGLWSSPDFSTYGGSTGSTTFTLRAVATANKDGGNYNGICKLEDLTANYSLSAGQILLPSLSESDSSRHYITMTIVLKVPLI